MCQMCDLAFVGFAEPQTAMLDSYVDALKRGWSPSTTADVGTRLLDIIAADTPGYLSALADNTTAIISPGATRTLADGRTVPALPQRTRWIWDGDFCGVIDMRWQPGTIDLPPPYLGHVGYAIVPWKRGHGYAKRALRHMLSEARDVGLVSFDVCTTADNVASQRVALANGATLIGTFYDAANDPAIERQRFRITL